MPVQIFTNEFTPLSADKLAQWATIPPAIAGDVMNRQNVMAGRISPLSPGMTMAGQARTVAVLAGDNAALHEVIGRLRPNEVLVIDAANYDDRAVWGGILNTRAKLRNINGVVLDGAARDAAEMREMGQSILAPYRRLARIKAGAARLTTGLAVAALRLCQVISFLVMMMASRLYHWLVPTPCLRHHWHA